MKILIAEDDADSKIYLERVLRGSGFVVDSADNGSVALQKAHSSPPDLIISDIEMPNLDGISMSSVALSMNPLVKIILISAYDKFEYAKQAIRLGVCDYIEKPVDYQYLTEKVKNAFS